MCDNSAIVPFDNFAYDSQTYASAFVCIFPVQALEDSKDAVRVFLVETDTVILDAQQAIFLTLRSLWRIPLKQAIFQH